MVFDKTVPASGNIYISPIPNQGAGWIQDGVMMLYTGSCSALTSYTCSDDYNYPAGYNDLQPFIRATGLTPGSTVYLRYWGFGSAQGNFGFCVQSPTNDLCANALYICDINGYSATTSPAYTRDHPCNMRGNGEGPGPTYTYSVNANPAGPFGAGGAWGSGSAINDVYIDNNSWVRFTAASPTVSLRVTVYNCWGVGTNSITATPGTPRGVQMQIFSTSSACCGFTPVSDYKENASGSFSGGVSTYTVNANSLTVGNDYYVMVDGWSGDICNYNIQAIAGVALPEITAVPGTICPGNSSILTAPSGATGYTWAPTGETTQTISVSPGTQMTYTCYVGGVCGYKQTLTKTVYLYPTPTVSTTISNSVICNGNSTTLSGTGASTYTWSGGISNGVAFSPTTSATYTVIGTSVNGCTNTAVASITVNSLPTVSVSASNTVICSGDPVTLTGGGTASTYTWTGGISNGVAFSPTTTTTYTVTGTDGNSCFSKAVSTVSVNPKPTVSSIASNTVICNGNSVTLNGTGANSYTWTGGVSDGVAFTPTATTTYTVIGTNAITGCTNSAVRTVSVTNLPNVNANASNSVICNGQSTTLNGTGASTYTWTGGISNGVAFSPTTTTSYTVTGTASGCTNTAVATITVNSLPTVSSTASNSVICNGQSTILNGTGANTYTWTGGITNGAAFTPTTTTSYTVTGIDGNNCINYSVRTITVNALPSTTVSTNGTVTCASNTVNLISSLSGASYTWTAPGGSSISGGTANNQNAIGQGTGVYTLQVMNSFGCTSTATIAANINTLTPTASATGGTLTCATTSTILTGSPASGVSYFWSGPGILGSNTSANITATVVGNYSLVTTSLTNGCSSTVTAIATVTNNLTTPTVSAGSSQTITCAAPSVTLTGTATPGSNYNWSSGANTNTAVVSGSGIYTLSATNPTTGCSSSSTVQVVPSAGTPNGTLGAITNSITCTNSVVAVSITSTSTPISISWSGPSITGSTNTASTTVSQGGTYTVTLTNTLSLCSQAYPVVVPTNTTPVNAIATIAPSTSITCSTNSVVLSATPTGTNYTYNWSGANIISGGTTSNPTVAAGGIYTVTITNTINGCSGATGTTTVSVPTNTTAPTLSLSANSVTTTCGNPSATITATASSGAGTTYSWTSPSTGTINNPNINNPIISGQGVFTVTATNNINGCTSSVATLTLTQDANIPTFTLSSANAEITCSNTAPTVTLTSTTGNITYSWSPQPSSGANTPTPSFTLAGNYTCVITNTLNNCVNSVPLVTVTNNTTLPTVNISPSTSITCLTTSVLLSSTVTPSTATYSWSGNGITTGVNNNTVTVNTSGIYSLSVTNTSNGCVGSMSTSVASNTNSPILNVSSTSTVLTCGAGSSSTLTALSVPSSTIVWNTTSGSASNPFVVTIAGIYSVTATDTINGCSTTQTINIINSTIPPDANAGAAIIIPCSSPSVTLNGTSTSTNAVSYSWAGPQSGSIISGDNTNSPTVINIGTYTLTVTDLITGCSATSTVNVSQNNVLADFTASPLTGETPLSVTFTNTSTNATSYTWNFGNGQTSTQQDPNTIFNNSGTYTVVLIASSGSCQDTATKIIIVEDGFTIEVPNVFTPNGDGVNDLFHIKISGVKSAEGTIYNRWGQVLYSWDALNTSWDGKASNGEFCPDANYYYIIKVIDKKDKEHLVPGFVLIAR